MEKNYWRHKRVFVTGGTGFLGSWLVKYLTDYGADVTVLVRDHVPQSYFYRTGQDAKVNIVNGALEDYLLLERILGEYEIETIFHLGAQTIVEIANRNPLSTFEANIKGTWNVLEAARRSPAVKKILIASSDKAYGIHEKLPYDEMAPLQGKYPYDVSKSAADLIAQSYFATYQLPVTITRCGNFFGGGDFNFNRLIPGTIRSFLHKEAPIIRSNGKFLRDYFYIEDAVDAYLHLAEKMDDQKIHGQAFNFSPENHISVLEVVDKIRKILKTNIRPKIMNVAQHEIPSQYLSSQKARKVLHWGPHYTLEEGLKRTIDWYKKYFELK